MSQADKITAAIRVIEAKPEVPHTRDLTTYTLEDGRELKTTERVCPEVTPVTSRLPNDNEVFQANGLPNHGFLREHFRQEGRLTESQALKILQMASECLGREPNLLHVPAPVTVCGDIHGQYFDLLKLFEIGGDPATTPYLFLGDYVDRGSFSFECLIYLYALKLNYPKTFWMLRGNHECKHLTSYFTFKSECLHKYNLKVYNACCSSFNTLPLAAIMNNQYFCVHGGLSPDLIMVEDLNKFNRFRETPSRGLMCDLMWADPEEDYDENRSKELFIPNQVRGCSYAFTFKAACEFLQRNNLLSIIRAHEAQDAGYRMYKNSPKLGFPTLMTLFSAPNYLDTYKNKAAILKYDKDVMNIRQFNVSPHPYWLPNFMDVFTWSLPFVGEKVSDMLVSILNICTEEELDGDSHSVTEESDVPEFKSKLLADAAKRRALRNKILAIAKVSRMYNVLRQDADKVQHLKAMNSGILPRGALSHGSEGLEETLSAFERAKAEDLKNERMPPSFEELQKIHEEQEKALLNKMNSL